MVITRENVLQATVGFSSAYCIWYVLDQLSIFELSMTSEEKHTAFIIALVNVILAGLLLLPKRRR